jgi:hypothetical protein
LEAFRLKDKRVRRLPAVYEVFMLFMTDVMVSIEANLSVLDNEDIFLAERFMK